MLEDTYIKIISAKTAELFAAATKVGAILSDVESKEKDALEFYGRNLGLTFQIADDTLDYNSELKFTPCYLLFQELYIFSTFEAELNDFRTHPMHCTFHNA